MAEAAHPARPPAPAEPQAPPPCDASPGTAAAAAAEAALRRYLDAYNAHDLEAVLSYLHPNCEVVYKGSVVARGRDAMAPSYQRDWEQVPGARVSVVGDCSCSSLGVHGGGTGSGGGDDEQAVEVGVRLRKDPGAVDVDVTYVFEVPVGRMVRHVITRATGEASAAVQGGLPPASQATTGSNER